MINFLQEFWQSQSDACPLDQDESEDQEIMFQKWIEENHPGAVYLDRIKELIDNAYNGLNLNSGSGDEAAFHAVKEAKHLFTK